MFTWVFPYLFLKTGFTFLILKIIFYSLIILKYLIYNFYLIFLLSESPWGYNFIVCCVYWCPLTLDVCWEFLRALWFWVLILSAASLFGLLWHLGWMHLNLLERFWVCFCQAWRNIFMQLWSSWTTQVLILTLYFYGARLFYLRG